VLDLAVEESSFKEQFGRPAEIVVRAPGRVEVIGGHTDYNDGFVLPMAIDRHCLICSSRRSDGKVRVFSEFFGQQCEFDLSASLTPGQPQWANYVKGVVALLLRAGKRLVGLDMYVTCSVPAGGGLSSSAALEVGYAKSFLAAAGESFGPVPLALLCREAENTFADAPCGIMDQFICVLARAGSALLLDCRSQQYEHVPMPLNQADVLIADTRVKHELGASEYPVRQQQCFRAVEILKRYLPEIKALRDVDPDTLEEHADKLEPALLARARHIVTENLRVLQSAEAFRHGDLPKAGELMSRSHDSLRDNYQVSCDELDFLVDRTRQCNGVYGARMSGGGFGGCMVAIVDRQASHQVQRTLIEAYRSKYHIDPGVFVTAAAGAAEVIRS